MSDRPLDDVFFGREVVRRLVGCSSHRRRRRRRRQRRKFPGNRLVSIGRSVDNLRVLEDR